MQLLPKDTVKEQVDKKEKEKKARIEGLQNEETQITHRINKLRDDEKTEKNRIAAGLAADTRKADLKRDSLNKELETLDKKVADRREELADLLKPIDEVKAKADKKLAEVEAREATLGQAENDLQNLNEEVGEALEDLQDRTQEADEREERLDTREKKVKEVEERIGKSADELADKWTHYHETVHKENVAIATKETELKLREEGLNNFHKTLKDKELELVRKEHGLKDRYATLERTEKELLGGGRNPNRDK